MGRMPEEGSELFVSVTNSILLVDCLLAVLLMSGNIFSLFLLVLESWLDFTGELEPPDPLARLPQLKRHIKQLLLDMGKVQQIATLCSV